PVGGQPMIGHLARTTSGRGPASAPGRVAILLPDLGGGGAERIALNLAQSMVENGNEVDLVVINPVGPLVTKVPPGVHMVSLGTGQASRSLFALIRYLRRVRPSLLISHLHAVNMLAVVARKLAAPSVRLAVTIHNNLHLDLASES